MALLQYYYYASLLLPLAFLALAGQIEPLVRNLSSRSFAWLAAAAALILVASWAVSFDPERLAGLPGPPVLLPFTVGLGVAAAAGLGARRGFGVVLTAVLCLAASQGLARQIATPFQQWSRHFDGDARGFFLQIDRSFTLLQRADPSHLQLRLWYDIYDGNAGRLCDTIASTFLLCTRMVGGRFPLLESHRMCDGVELVPSTRIALLSARPEAEAQARTSLQAVGFASRVTSRHPIGGPVRGFTITFLEIAPAAPADTVP
jgi:hypothetical protein